MFTEPHPNTRRVRRILESYANPNMLAQQQLTILFFLVHNISHSEK